MIEGRLWSVGEKNSDSGFLYLQYYRGNNTNSEMNIYFSISE